MLGIDGRRRRRLQPAGDLGFDGDAFAISLANFTRVPLHLTAVLAGSTYRGSEITLEFPVDSSFTFPLNAAVNHLPDAFSVATLLTNLTPQQLVDLLGPQMAALGLRIISFSVFGPDLVALSVPPPPNRPPIVAALTPSSMDLAGTTTAEGLSASVTRSTVHVGRAAAMLTTVLIAYLVPSLMILALYLRRKRFDSQFEIRRQNKPKGLGMSHESPLDGSWFNACSDSFPENEPEQTGDVASSFGKTPEMGGHARAGTAVQARLTRSRFQLRPFRSRPKSLRVQTVLDDQPLNAAKVNMYSATAEMPSAESVEMVDIARHSSSFARPSGVHAIEHAQERFRASTARGNDKFDAPVTPQQRWLIQALERASEHEDAPATTVAQSWLARAIEQATQDEDFDDVYLDL